MTKPKILTFNVRPGVTNILYNIH